MQITVNVPQMDAFVKLVGLVKHVGWYHVPNNAMAMVYAKTVLVHVTLILLVLLVMFQYVSMIVQGMAHVIMVMVFITILCVLVKMVGLVMIVV
jgi:hypothetical protein